MTLGSKKEAKDVPENAFYGLSHSVIRLYYFYGKANTKSIKSEGAGRNNSPQRFEQQAEKGFEGAAQSVPWDCNA